jgi:hypothetical protein
MGSIEFENFKIDIEVHNIDGIFSHVFDITFSKGFWVLLTIYNSHGEKESFPHTDNEYRLKIYESYEEAIDDVANLLKGSFKL